MAGLAGELGCRKRGRVGRNFGIDLSRGSSSAVLVTLISSLSSQLSFSSSLGNARWRSDVTAKLEMPQRHPRHLTPPSSLVKLTVSLSTWNFSPEFPFPNASTESWKVQVNFSFFSVLLKTISHLLYAKVGDHSRIIKTIRLSIKRDSLSLALRIWKTWLL